MIARTEPTAFYGWRVVAAAFVLAVFGWGVGFYGPPVYLHAVRESRGWPLSLLSAAVTSHFLIGTLVIANLPRLYARFGLSLVTKVGALSLATGVVGWALAREPWQLFAATALTGSGWVAMGAVAVNAIVSRWFVRMRPKALATAYNGASIGGVIFSPLWVAAIGLVGFPTAAIVIGATMVLAIWIIADLLLSRSPEQMGLAPDGDATDLAERQLTAPGRRPLPDSQLWRDARFLTLAGGMALGLFAQIGLIAHLFSLLVPAFGAPAAGLAMGGATAAAIAGRTLVGWLISPATDRRLVACANHAMQILGSAALLLAAGDNVGLLLIGTILFGAGIGNATSLPPLIAQVEFARQDVGRVVALTIATAQGAYAFAPAVFGLVREMTPPASGASAGAAPYLFATAALIQALAIATFLAGRRR